MKLLPFIALGICLVTAGCQAAPQQPAKVLLAQAQPSKVAQVKAGTLKTAKASWWGFEKADATEALQNAINSGASKLIVDNMGSDWIIGKPIHLASNQTIIFEDGVVIQAKKDAFHGGNDSLFTGSNLTNLTLQGEGNVVFRMRKKDYQNPKLYSRAEWRMGIKLINCKNVVIRNLTVTETGGDGLYLGASRDGYCENVLVENCNFIANHRLGMAVISVENLTVRNCKFNDTRGTGPNGGIDFEPNYSGQRLVNIVMENCEFNNNPLGSGMAIYAVNLNGDSKPISMTFKNCRAKGNARGFDSTIANREGVKNPATGEIKLINCFLDHNPLRLRNPQTNSVQYTIKNSVVDFGPINGKYDKNQSPIVISTDSNIGPIKVGNITFDHTNVVVGEGVPPIAAEFQRGAVLTGDITGTLLVTCNGQTKPYDLTSFIAAQQKYWSKINSLKPATVDLAKLQVPATDSVRADNSSFFLQGPFTFLQYAEEGQEITLNVTAHKSYDRDTIVELQDPSGKKLKSYTLPLTAKPFAITFTAQQTGLYRLVRKSTFSQRIDINSSHRGSGLLAEKTVRFLPVKGQLYFQVPAGVKDFTLSISTDSSADVSLLNAQGEEVERHKGISKLQLFEGHRDDASKSEIWSLKLNKAIWVVDITLYAPLVPIVSTNPATMLVQ